MSATIREVVKQLGGTAELARLLDCRQSTISEAIAADVMPFKYHVPLLWLAVKHGIDWRPPGWRRDLHVHIGPARRRRAGRAATSCAASD